MRICIVTVASYAHGIGGMQGHVADLCRGLVEAGHVVEIVAPKHPEGLEQTEHLGGTWHFGDVPPRKPGRPNRNRDWLSSSVAIAMFRSLPGPTEGNAMAYVVKRRLKTGGYGDLVRYHGPDGKVH